MPSERATPATTTDPVKRRRRGAELEHALLTAAWEQLVEVGFAKLTMESVADRARSGVAVLYRRWADKNDLVLATLRHYGDTHPIAIPDTGNLRDDLLALLENIDAERNEFAMLIGATFAGLHHSTGLTPDNARRIMLGDRPPRSFAVYRRAHDRGEIDLARIPEDVLELPFQLIRHDMLMTMRPSSPERLRSIVDDLFWPLVTRP